MIEEPDPYSQFLELVDNLGMSEEDAIVCLGLDIEDQKSEDRLLEDSFHSVPSSSEALIKEIFPHVPNLVLKEKLETYNNDIEKVSEDLLSWSLVAEETKLVENVKERKQAKIFRRKQRQYENKIEKSINDVQILAQTLKISLDDAARIYSENNLSFSHAVQSKAKPILPNYETEFAVLRNPTYVHTYDQKVPAKVPDDDNSEILDEYAEFTVGELRQMLNQTNIQLLCAKKKYSDINHRQDLARSSLNDTSDYIRTLKSKLELIKATIKNLESFPGHKVVSNNEDSGTNQTLVMDLHGDSVAVAELRVSHALRTLDKKPNCSFKIVTGKGLHSAEGKPILKPWLKEFMAGCTQYNVSSYESYVVVTKRK
ncbi:hypothetical protein DASB73_017280 [Starmerella bacillaris]|uniref:Smr domain-containing protein n=1 Tax=Starmerella bacillaris TaxID=1247836 RepID=A0AAV5RGV8_STABA|nr:hypothetical protein DASB73_017280 [Starmerella bacillaris]